VLTGPVAESIIDYAKENNIDLIIISSHGRSGLGRWVYGSIAEKVLRGARCCSTWLVRPTVSESAAATKEQEEHSIPLQ
jgi:K+-sensing histidine kinase KdpD